MISFHPHWIGVQGWVSLAIHYLPNNRFEGPRNNAVFFFFFCSLLVQLRIARCSSLSRHQFRAQAVIAPGRVIPGLTQMSGKVTVDDF